MNHNLCIICYQENEFATISDAMPGCHCHQFRPTLCYECVYAVCKCRRNDDDGETEGERYQEDEMDDLIEEFDALHLLDEREENEMNELIHDFNYLRIIEDNYDDGETDGERDQEDEMDDLIEEFDALHLLDEREENEMNELIHDFDHLRIFEEEVEWDMEWDHEWEPNMNLALYN